MKKTFKNILCLTGKTCHFLQIGVLCKVIISCLNYIYTGFLSKKFKHFGNSYIFWHAYHLEGLNYIIIGDNTTIESDVQLTAWKFNDNIPQIVIGNDCLIRRGAHITAINRIEIGNNLLTGTNVFISDNSHGNTNFETLKNPPNKRHVFSKGAIKIGNNVWLGNNVCILAGVTIGDGVVVGANSVVTHDVPAYSIIAGTPAKRIK